jgi:hypothetical protein
MPDIEWLLPVMNSKVKVMALGVSFTEGDGAAYDSSYVAVLKRKLTDSFYVMNAGVCGSDPYYNYVLLRDKLLKYHPNLVLQTLSTQDFVTDIAVRGGMERFLPDGTQRFKPAPKWEPIYAVSYLSRLYFSHLGYNAMLRKEGVTNEEKVQMNSSVAQLMTDYAALCDSNHIKLYLLLRPDKVEIINQRYDYDWASAIASIKTKTNIEVIDLMPYYTRYLATNKLAVNNCFWKIDGHHNARGYEMMGSCIYEAIFR